MDKVVSNVALALDGLRDGMTLAVGGFGLCGVPSVLIAEVLRRGTTALEIVSNNAGVDDWGLGLLLGAGRIRRIIASYVGENKEFARQYLSGELEVELTPQGTLAEKLRAGGSGIAAFYTATGVGSQVSAGGMPWRYDSAGEVFLSSPAKDTKTFDHLGERGPQEYVLETSIAADIGLVRAWKGDRHGNLVFRASARNFNPLCAMSGRFTVAEVEELVEPGVLLPDDIHLPGIYVQRVLPLTPAQAQDKRIEKLTTSPAPSSPGSLSTEGGR
ncbi:MAG: CoA transferase subunit A [Ornithinimicrobium sp.]